LDTGIKKNNERIFGEILKRIIDEHNRLKPSDALELLVKTCGLLVTSLADTRFLSVHPGTVIVSAKESNTQAFAIQQRTA